jgi:hypothetical protein
MVKEYIILMDYTTDELVKAVNYKLKNGWQLQGGVSITFYNHMTKFCQAMIKVEENK